MPTIDLDDDELRALARTTDTMLNTIDLRLAGRARPIALERAMVKLIDAAHAGGVEGLDLPELR